jgi:hypothetical protein
VGHASTSWSRCGGDLGVWTKSGDACPNVGRRTATTGRLEPASATIIAPAKEHEQYNDDEQKCCRVHDALL